MNKGVVVKEMSEKTLKPVNFFQIQMQVLVTLVTNCIVLVNWAVREGTG